MRTLVVFAALLCLAAPAVGAEKSDWPQWQGPDRDAVSEETGLLQEWPEGGPPLAWRTDGLGGGDSAPAIADGRVYGMSNRDGQEIVWALSEEDGRELWASPLGPAVEQDARQSREGPGGTPTVDGGKLYVIGMGGAVACLNAADGELLWKRSMTEDFGGVVPRWSYRESPLVADGKVFCTPGGPEALMAALDKSTGETVWTTPPPAAEPVEEEDDDNGRGRRRRGRGGPSSGAAYASPILIEAAGERQVVQLAADALVGVDVDTGELLWRYAAPANRNKINCSTPLYEDGLVFASSAYGNGGGAAKLTEGPDGGVQAEEVYFTRAMQNHHGGMVVTDGALYGANGGNEGGFLTCLDFATGEVLWRDRDAPKGSLMLADGRIYLRAEGGELLLIEPSRETLIVKGRFDQPDRTSSPAWAHPVVANGKLYVRDQGTLFAYDVAAD
ncbi:PQQ-binding-like beta-propeller repeat protein [Alienimonas sp. DA493]|uniref:outer membrane protein assembly factor BamB family protein n=1 Tax=Alienimonas sp. DA493 TaxID=3373605 RepID=UPI0037547E90